MNRQSIRRLPLAGRRPTRRIASRTSLPHRETAASDPGAPFPHWQSSRSRGPLDVSSAGPGPLPGVGRPRSGRAVVVLVRTGGGVPDPRTAHLPGRHPRGRDRGDDLHHLDGLQPDHRSLPPRWRRIRRGHEAAGRAGRRRLRFRAAGRLHPDDHRLDRGVRGCALQLPALCLASLEIPRGDLPRHRSHHPQHPRRPGIGHRHAPGLHPLPHHPPRAHRGRRHPARSPGRRDGGLHRKRVPLRPIDPGNRRNALPADPRLFARRRYLHRLGGGLERPADHARAPGPHGKADDDLHGDVARLHRRGPPASLSPLGYPPRGRQDLQRGSGGAFRFGNALRVYVHHPDAGLGRGPLDRRSAGRFHRRPARARRTWRSTPGCRIDSRRCRSG